MKRYLTTVFTLVALLMLGGEAHLPAQSQRNSPQFEKLQSFARTFGYVRYFHPSDQASLVDWEAFAFHGIDEIQKSKEGETTLALMERLFEPLVVELQIYEGQELPRPETKKVEGTEIIAWQHSGIAFDGANFPYRSARMNRPETVYAAASPYGNVSQSYSVVDLQNEEILTPDQMSVFQRLQEFEFQQRSTPISEMNPEKLRALCNELMKLKIAEIDDACRLSEAQGLLPFGKTKMN